MEEKIKNILEQSFNELQSRPNQYVVAIKTGDRLIGYHLSTFCQVTTDILEAKRYSGENPYSQLEIISKNIKYCIFGEGMNDGLFNELYRDIKPKFYQDLNFEDIYLDAVYLNENTPKQNFVFELIKT